MKRNTLTTAVMAGLTGMAGMVGVSIASPNQPVHVNPDGLGQALIYPYYTARDGNDTNFSVVNTTARGKAVKVRFLEALNSREALDFNLYLSPYDVWTAVVTEVDGGAVFRTADTSCTVPYFYGRKPAGQSYAEQEMFDLAYTGLFADGGPTGIERTLSGYIEVIEMGTFVEGSAFEKDLTHVYGTGTPADGSPSNCFALEDAWREIVGVWEEGDSTSDKNGQDTAITAPTGGLYGAGAIINVADGTMFSYNATAIDNLFVAQVPHFNPARLEPGLGDGDNLNSATFAGGFVQADTWSDGVYAVNATITMDSIWNEFVYDPALGANTEWVVTFPTKAYHIDVTGKQKVPLRPFPTPWPEDFGCITVEQEFQDVPIVEKGELAYFTYWDREERTELVIDDVFTSPPRPEPPPVSFCGEANVFRLASSESVAPDASDILREPGRSDSPLGYGNIPLADGYSAGHMRMDFSGFESVSSDEGTVIQGLPYVGFSVTTYRNDNITAGVRANYGASFTHRGTRGFVRSD